MSLREFVRERGGFCVFVHHIGTVCVRCLFLHTRPKLLCVSSVSLREFVREKVGFCVFVHHIGTVCVRCLFLHTRHIVLRGSSVSLREFVRERELDFVCSCITLEVCAYDASF